MKNYARGAKHGNWKGDEVGYSALHNYIRKWKPDRKWCARCRKEPPYDVANISQKYKRDLDDWERLCRRCHMKKDGRINRAGKPIKHSKKYAIRRTVRSKK